MAAQCLTVVRLQSVGMCGCVAGVAGAALEAVVVLLLFPVADAVHAVSLDRSELHAFNVHLCTEKVKNTVFVSEIGTEEEKRGTLDSAPTMGNIY